MKDYKKILEGVVNIINTTEKSDIGFANICTYISENCPELKEGEDERIRKALVEMVHDTTGDSLWVDYDVHKEDVLVWLEKQGEQNYQEKVVDNLHNYLYGEQKPTWSEEDENRFRNLIYLVEHSNDGKGTKEGFIKFINRLKSFKDRVQLQPKQKWSEEDEIAFGDALWCCKQAASIAKDENEMGNAWYAERWLKSLKERYTWKPSDEQINALEYYIYSNSPTATITKGTIFGNTIVELLEQLKKLREE